MHKIYLYITYNKYICSMYHNLRQRITIEVVKGEKN